MSCPRCLVLLVLSKMSYPECPLSTGTVVPSWLPYRSWMSCPRYLLSTAVNVPSRLSCLIVLFLLPYSGHSAFVSYPGCTIPSVFLTFLSQFSCPCFPVLVVLSRLSCPGCPVQAVLYQLSCLAVLSQPSHPHCPVPAALSQLSFSSCSAQTPLTMDPLRY